MSVFAGFEELVEQYLEQWKVPGVGLAVVKDGEIVFSGGFGCRNLQEKLPVTENTVFAIGSATKAFTTMGMAVLVDEGKLAWDKPVREYLPWFRMHDQFATERITPRDLVTHRSGLPRHDLTWYNSDAGREDIIRRLAHLEPSKDFRTAWQYQNIMYMTAGYLSGVVADMSWEELMDSRILAPLGMTESNFSVDKTQEMDNYALPYQYPYLQENPDLKPMKFRNIDTAGPAGSINSTPADMAKWLQLQLNGGKHGDKQIVSEGNLKQMHTPQMVIGPGRFTELPFSCYGMGWFVEPYRGINMVHHGGNIDGFSALVTFMPEKKTGMVILTNLNGNPLPTLLALSLYDRLLGLEPIDWNGRFTGEIEKAKKASAEQTEKTQADRKADTLPSHALEAYVGRYEHPGYGILEVKLTDEGKLQLFYNSLKIELSHYHYDVFEGKPEAGDSTMLISFSTDLKGNIGSLAAPLEPTLKPATFKRLADEQMTQLSFLEKFAGKYRLDPPGVDFSVDLKGENALTATLPGQPTYDLEPYEGNTFNFKGLPGFSIEFLLDDAGNVKEAKIVQPHGTVIAARK